MDYRVISIGTLAAHPHWGERVPVRTGHATTTLIRAGKRVIVVDPGLPGSVVAARLTERAGLVPEAVTHVFLTRFHADTCRGIEAFPRATWWISGEEREAVGVPIATRLREAAEAGDADVVAALQGSIAVLRRCEPAPDRLVQEGGNGVDLFPLPGVTPGLTGLLIGLPRSTVLVCGDAAPTVEHLEQGRVLNESSDVESAKRSLAEAVEIADVLVLGRDNAVNNPVRRGM